MLIKIHDSYREVIAICDKSLLGEKFEDGKKQLHIKEGFFGGKNIEKGELIDKMKDYDKEDATFNIVGENSVNAALEAEIINKEGIKKVEGIPFALVLL